MRHGLLYIFWIEPDRGLLSSSGLRKRSASFHAGRTRLQHA